MSYKTMVLLHYLLRVIAVLVVIWITITGVAWQFNNPKGNQSTFWTHFSDAMRFKRLPEFQ